MRNIISAIRLSVAAPITTINHIGQIKRVWLNEYVSPLYSMV